MPGEEHSRPVDRIFVQNDFENVDDILFAEFERVLRFRRYGGSLFCRGLRLAENGGQPERR